MRWKSRKGKLGERWGGAEGREGKIRLAMHSGAEEKHNFFNARVAGDDQLSSHACVLNVVLCVSYVYGHRTLVYQCQVPIWMTRGNSIDSILGVLGRAFNDALLSKRMLECSDV